MSNYRDEVPGIPKVKVEGKLSAAAAVPPAPGGFKPRFAPKIPLKSESKSTLESSDSSNLLMQVFPSA
jgi:hypothetical protein